jgi:hypothetical protein
MANFFILIHWGELSHIIEVKNVDSVNVKFADSPYPLFDHFSSFYRISLHFNHLSRIHFQLFSNQLAQLSSSEKHYSEIESQFVRTDIVRCTCFNRVLKNSSTENTRRIIAPILLFQSFLMIDPEINFQGWLDASDLFCSIVYQIPDLSTNMDSINIKIQDYAVSQSNKEQTFFIFF